MERYVRDNIYALVAIEMDNGQGMSDVDGRTAHALARRGLIYAAGWDTPTRWKITDAGAATIRTHYGERTEQ